MTNHQVGYDDLFGDPARDEDTPFEADVPWDPKHDPWWAASRFDSELGGRRRPKARLNKKIRNGQRTTIEVAPKAAARLLLSLRQMREALKQIEKRQGELSDRNWSSVYGVERDLHNALLDADAEVAEHWANHVLRYPEYYQKPGIEEFRLKLAELFQPHARKNKDVKRAYFIVTGPTRDDTNGNESYGENTKGYIYLAKSDTGHFKIGYSSDPDKRIEAFRTQMPVEVEKVHTFLATHASDAESTLHEWADSHRQKGEWFDLENHQVSMIKAISKYEDGQFIRGSSGEPINEELKSTLS